MGVYIYVGVYIHNYIDIGGYMGEYYRIIKGDTRSLDCSSCE